MNLIFKAALAASSIVIGSSASALAGAVVTTDQIIGTFSDPVVFGNVANDPVVGESTFLNNASSAINSITGANGNTLSWGGDYTNSVGTNFSSLTFSGASVPVANQTTPIALGTITYINGTSSINSLIFGATLTFSLNGTQLGSDKVIITTTSNAYSGTGLTLTEAQTDADYINICGNGSNICGNGIQAYENTEGTGGNAFSAPLVVTLNGTYSIDPGISLTSVDYTSGDGTVGGRAAVGAVPELSTWSMMLLGLAGLGLVAYRQSKKSPAVFAIT